MSAKSKKKNTSANLSEGRGPSRTAGVASVITVGPKPIAELKVSGSLPVASKSLLMSPTNVSLGRDLSSANLSGIPKKPVLPKIEPNQAAQTTDKKGISTSKRQSEQSKKLVVDKQKRGPTLTPTHSPAKMGIVGVLGTTGQVRMSARKRQKPVASSLSQESQEKAPAQPKSRKMSAVSSLTSEVMSYGTDSGMSHTTMQDMYVSKVEQKYSKLHNEGSQSLLSLPSGRETRMTRATDVDMLSTVSSASASHSSLSKSRLSVRSPDSGSRSHVARRNSPLSACSSVSQGMRNVSPQFNPLSSNSTLSHSLASRGHLSIPSQLHSSSLKLSVDLNQLPVITKEENVQQKSELHSPPHIPSVSGNGSGSCSTLRSFDEISIEGGVGASEVQSEKELQQNEGVSLSDTSSQDWSVEDVPEHDGSCLYDTPSHAAKFERSHSQASSDMHSIMSFQSDTQGQPRMGTSLHSGSGLSQHSSLWLNRTEVRKDEPRSASISQGNDIFPGQIVIPTEFVEVHPSDGESTLTAGSESEKSNTHVSCLSLDGMYPPPSSFQDTVSGVDVSGVDGSVKSAPVPSVAHQPPPMDTPYHPTSMDLLSGDVSAGQHPNPESIYSSEPNTNLPSQRPSIALSSDLVQFSSRRSTPVLFSDEQDSTYSQSDYEATARSRNIEFLDRMQAFDTNTMVGFTSDVYSQRSSPVYDIANPEFTDVDQSSISSNQSVVVSDKNPPLLMQKKRLNTKSRKTVAVGSSTPTGDVITSQSRVDQVVSGSDVECLPFLPQIIPSSREQLPYFDEVLSESEGPLGSKLHKLAGGTTNEPREQLSLESSDLDRSKDNGVHSETESYLSFSQDSKNFAEHDTFQSPSQNFEANTQTAMISQTQLLEFLSEKDQARDGDFRTASYVAQSSVPQVDAPSSHRIETLRQGHKLPSNSVQSPFQSHYSPSPSQQSLLGSANSLDSTLQPVPDSDVSLPADGTVAEIDENRADRTAKLLLSRAADVVSGVATAVDPQPDSRSSVEYSQSRFHSGLDCSQLSATQSGIQGDFELTQPMETAPEKQAKQSSNLTNVQNHQEPANLTAVPLLTEEIQPSLLIRTMVVPESKPEGEFRSENAPSDSVAPLRRVPRRALNTDDVLSQNATHTKESLADYLASTKGPVTLADLLSVKGESLLQQQVEGDPVLSSKQTGRGADTQTFTPNTLRARGKGEELSHLASTSSTDFTSEGKENLACEAQEWRRYNIHHFCSMLTAPALLPSQMQIMSARAHTASTDVDSGGGGDRGRGRGRGDCVDDSDGTVVDQKAENVARCTTPGLPYATSLLPLSQSTILPLSQAQEQPSPLLVSASRVEQLMESFKVPTRPEQTKSVDAFRPVKTAESSGGASGTSNTPVHCDDKEQRTQPKESAIPSVVAEVGTAVVAPKQDLSLPALRESEEQSDLSIRGLQVRPETTDLNLVWRPAPPKFSLHPKTVKRFLFPNYNGLSKEERRKTQNREQVEASDALRRLRLANRAFKSLNDLTELRTAENNAVTEESSKHARDHTVPHLPMYVESGARLSPVAGQTKSSTSQKKETLIDSHAITAFADDSSDDDDDEGNDFASSHTDSDGTGEGGMDDTPGGFVHILTPEGTLLKHSDPNVQQHTLKDDQLPLDIRKAVDSCSTASLTESILASKEGDLLPLASQHEDTCREEEEGKVQEDDNNDYFAVDDREGTSSTMQDDEDGVEYITKSTPAVSHNVDRHGTTKQPGWEEIANGVSMVQPSYSEPLKSNNILLRKMKQPGLVSSSPFVGGMTHLQPQEEDFKTILEETKALRKQFLQQCSLASVADHEDLSDIGSTLSRVESKGFLKGSRKFSRRSQLGRPSGAAKGRKTRRTKSAELRASHARQMLSKPAAKIRRSMSIPLLSSDMNGSESTQELQPTGARRRCSLPGAPNFTAFMKEQGADPRTSEPYQWAMSTWDKWFDEVYAEYRAVWEAYKRRNNTMYNKYLTKANSSKKADGVMLPTPKVQKKEDVEEEEEEYPELENLHFFLLTEPPDRVRRFQNEIDKLDRSIGSVPPVDTLAVQLCRRGGLLRQLGKLRSSKEDLDRCIRIQPKFAAAYFLRHLLHLIQGNEKAALEDLSSVLKHNRRHTLALQSKATMLHSRGELSEALELMNRAVLSGPNNPGVHMFRGRLLDEKGHSEMAVLDYARSAELDRTNTEGLMKQAMHYYRKGFFEASCEAFTKLLQRDPNNTDARIYRARVESKMGEYTTALEDLSAVIHLNPNNPEPFLLRGCLLRRTHPKSALRDISTSLLLNDTRSNISAYLHRGTLYSEIGRYDEALTDFDMVVQMDPNMSCAYISIGLIYFSKYGIPGRGITYFTRALKSDPTYCRAYLCRAEALMALQDYTAALRDLTTIIHLKPDQPSYYLMKGYVHLLLAEYDQAELYVRASAGMSGPLDGLAVQDAAMATFLGDTAAAERILLEEVRRKPSGENLLLLGKIYQKDGRYREAFDIISTAAKTLIGDPDYGHALRSTVAAFCGRCLLELGEHRRALSYLSKAVKLDPTSPQVYYYRSLCKLEGGDTQQALTDINKSLDLDPSQYEVTLKRAGMFYRQGRVKKAIFNCSKAIQIEPSSARAYMYRGCYRMMLLQYTDALKDLDQAVSLCPASSVIYFNRACCHQAIGHHREAIEDYTNCLDRQNKPSVKVFVNRGMARLQMEEFTDALEDFIQAAELNPMEAKLYQAIGLCYHNLGDLELSVEAYSCAVKLDPFFWEALISRGNAQLERLTPDGMRQSMKDYMRVLRTDPFNTPARINAAYLLQMEGKLRQAWDHFSVVLLYREEEPRALEGRAIVSLQAGYLDGALLDINRALQVTRTPELLTNRGVIHEYKDDRVNAGRDYSEALQMDPAYPLAHFNLGNLYFHHRQFQQAIDCYSRASSLQPGSESPLVNRAICLSIQGHFTEALQDLTKAAEVNSFAAHVFYNRGNIYRTLGRYQEAEDDYLRVLTLQPDDYLGKAGLQNIAALKKFAI